MLVENALGNKEKVEDDLEAEHEENNKWFTTRSAANKCQDNLLYTQKSEVNFVHLFTNLFYKLFAHSSE